MSFVHDDPEFDDLLQIVSRSRGLGAALVETDYWVTHTLWALQAQGFEIWFKGGTSLSKGFGLIERFSEDLDLKLESGIISSLRALADDLVAQRQIATLPSSMHAAFNPSEHDRWRAVQKAHAAIAPMFWGSRLSLEEASTDIRCWIDAEFGR